MYSFFSHFYYILFFIQFIFIFSAFQRINMFIITNLMIVNSQDTTDVY